jgi:protease I
MVLELDGQVGGPGTPVENDQRLKGRRVAILVANGFEQSELTGPRQALEDAGAETRIISPEEGQVRGWQHKEWGDSVPVDLRPEDASVDDYDALLLPGGVMNPDRLRADPAAVAFVKAFFEAAKPVAAICHGPWTLIDAEVVRGRTVTSWPSLRRDLENAGAHWVDREVVLDRGLVTSRKPDDILAFNRTMLEAFAKAPASAS